MHDQIRRQRHQASFDLLANLFKFMFLLPRSICAVFAHVEMFAAVIDVIAQPPANRSYLRVPRIYRLVRVAIIARPRHYLLYIGGNANDRFDCFRGVDRRIRPVDPNELYEHENHDNTDNHDLHNAHTTAEFYTLAIAKVPYDIRRLNVVVKFILFELC